MFSFFYNYGTPISTPPQDSSTFDSFSSRLGDDADYGYDNESMQGDGSRELDGVEYMEGEGPSREQVALGSSAAYQRERSSRSSSYSSSRRRHGNFSTDGTPVGDDTLMNAEQEWDESRSKTPLASAAAWARKQQVDQNLPPQPELVTALRADADARKASFGSSEKTPVVHSSGRAFPDSSEKPSRKKSSSGRRAATEGGTGDTSRVPLSVPAPQRAVRRSFFGRKDRNSDGASEASFSANESSVAEDNDGMEELHATDSIASSVKSGAGSRNSGSFWNFGKKGNAVKAPTPSRTPRPGDVSAAHQNKDSSSDTDASESDLSENEEGRAGSDGSVEAFSAAVKNFKDPKLGKEAPTLRHLTKTRYKGKSSKDRNFSRLFLVQELPLGIVGLADDESAASRRSSMVSTSGSGNGFEQTGRNSMDSKSSMDGRRSGDHVPKRRSMHHMDSSASISSDISSSSTVASNLTCAASSTGGSSSNGNAKSKRKATWSMKFSLDGMYLAVAGQDSVVRVFQVLHTPQARKTELESQNSTGSNPLSVAIGAGLNGGSNPSLASSNGSNTGSSGRSKSKGSGFGPPLAEGVAPVFSSTPIREYRGHLSDVLDLSWSKVSSSFSSRNSDTGFSDRPQLSRY